MSTLMESPGDQAALDADRETIRLYTWRLEELGRAGYDAASASLIAAELHVDLHRAVSLVRRGCSVELALQILL